MRDVRSYVCYDWSRAYRDPAVITSVASATGGCNHLRIGSPRSVAIALVLLLAGLTMLQPVGGQPGQWRSINPVFTNLNDVWMASASNGWAVGDRGRAIRWDGNRWEDVLTPYSGSSTANLNSVSCLSVSRCLAVGNDTADAEIGRAHV